VLDELIIAGLADRDSEELLAKDDPAATYWDVCKGVATGDARKGERRVVWEPLSEHGFATVAEAEKNIARSLEMKGRGFATGFNVTADRRRTKLTTANSPTGETSGS
jgi:hypothetical protein